MNNDGQLREIAFIKTIMMLIIVLYHSCLFFGGTWFNYVKPLFKADYLFTFAKWMNTFHIHAFTMASGFLFYYLKIEKNKYISIIDSIKKKVKRLIIPYVFTTLIWVLPITYYFFKYPFNIILHKYILCESPSQLWFLIMLFIVFCIFIIFYKKIRISTNNLIIVYIFSTLLSLLCGYFDINYFQINLVFKFILFFYIGGYLYMYRKKIKIKNILILIIILGCLMCGLYIIKNEIIKKIINTYTLQLLSSIEVILIYFWGNYFANIKAVNLNCRIYKLLQENSFGIYLFHQQIVYFCIILLNGLVHPIIQVILSFVISLSISLLMSIILKKNKITKFMFGL